MRSVALDVGSLAGDVPVIEELTLEGALINAEQREAASNLTDIQRHVSESPSDAAREPGRIVIERFRLRNARVLLTSEYLSEPEELPLRDVVVEDIGSARAARPTRKPPKRCWRRCWPRRVRPRGAFARSGGRCRRRRGARRAGRGARRGA